MNGTRTCARPSCGRTFTPASSVHRYCSSTCRVADFRRVERAELRRLREQLRTTTRD